MELSTRSTRTSWNMPSKLATAAQPLPHGCVSSFTTRNIIFIFPTRLRMSTTRASPPHLNGWKPSLPKERFVTMALVRTICPREKRSSSGFSMRLPMSQPITTSAFCPSFRLICLIERKRPSTKPSQPESTGGSPRQQHPDPDKPSFERQHPARSRTSGFLLREMRHNTYSGLIAAFTEKSLSS